MESLTTDIGAWLHNARQQLVAAENPGLEAQLLLGSLLNQSRAEVLTHPERMLTHEQDRALASLLQRRLNGEPLPYILGHWEFFGLDLLVTPAVLIPRPETELLVEQAILWLKNNPGRRQVADVGVGSGAISVAIASQVADVHVMATDLSMLALRVARQNIQRHNLPRRISLVNGDLLTPLFGPFDLVCANLPYIPTATLQELEVRRHEPVMALDGGVDGLQEIERLLADSIHWMAPGGRLLLEIDAGHGESALDLAHRVLPAAAAQVLPDHAGLPRLLRIDI